MNGDYYLCDHPRDFREMMYNIRVFIMHLYYVYLEKKKKKFVK